MNIMSNLSRLFVRASAGIVVTGSAFALFAGYADPAGAEKTLQNAGYTNIQTGGVEHSPFVCRGFYRTKFEATGANGKAVTGVVCSGGKLNNPQIVVAPEKPTPKYPRPMPSAAKHG